MIEYKRTKIANKYSAIQIFECPIEIMLFIATLGGNNITIENYRDYSNTDSVALSIHTGSLITQPILKQFSADFQISRTDFIILKEIWNEQGCYAIFHESDTIKFRATDLNELSRYKALDNFTWTLEMIIPNSASDGWGQITSPFQDIIDTIEKHIQNQYNS